MRSELDALKARMAEVAREEAANGAACGWRSCTGCHESHEGVPQGEYSTLFGCHVGSGCSECGGLGVVWEYWTADTLDQMARDVSEPLAALPQAEPGWRSMDSAPKQDGKHDGPSILLYGGVIAYDSSDYSHPNSRVVEAYWSLVERDWIIGNDEGHDEYIRLHAPEGWMPIPTAPTPAIEEGRSDE